MYDLTDYDMKNRIEELVELFDLSPFINQPVRKLSLGQRMRAEVAVSLIHRPKMIFLDEPTIGLDVSAKKSLRDLLIKLNKEEKTTIFLTSHDVGDIEALCERSIIINQGEIVKDTLTKDLAKSFAFEKYINLYPKDIFTKFPPLPDGIRYYLKKKEKVAVLVNTNTIDLQDSLKKLLDLFEVADIDVLNTDLETIIRHIYEK